MPAGAMSAASAYEEKWPGAEIDLESILGAVIGAESDGAAVRELKKLLTTIVPARMAGSDAASRDLVKICTIMNDIVKGMEALKAHPERVVSVVSGSHGDAVPVPRANAKPGNHRNLAELDDYRVAPGMDIWVLPGFAQNVLGIDPADIMKQLERYPVRGQGDTIEPMTVQWVQGTNKALNYRGKPVKRNKMWLQRGCPRGTGYPVYSYTGHQAPIIPAQASVDMCPEVSGPLDKLDAWAEKHGQKLSNQTIITVYPDGSYHIGYHFDKPQSIEKDSLIIVVKTGKVARHFAIRERLFMSEPDSQKMRQHRAIQKLWRQRAKQLEQECKQQVSNGLRSRRGVAYRFRLALAHAEMHKKAAEAIKKMHDKKQSQVLPFFDQMLQPGTGVIMSLDANLRTQHAVLPCGAEVGSSGSIVFRTIDSIMSTSEVASRLQRFHTNKAKKAEKAKTAKTARSRDETEAVSATCGAQERARD